MTSMPSSPRRLERMTASGPCSARTCANAARMLAAVYRFIFMSTSTNHSSSTSDRGNHSDAAVFRYLVVGQHRERRGRVAHQLRDPGPDFRRNQQYRGLTRRLLAPRAVGERRLNFV